MGTILRPVPHTIPISLEADIEVYYIYRNMCVTNRILYVIGLRAKTEHPPIKLFRNTATLPDFTIFSVDLGRNLESNQKLKAQLNSQGYFKFEINLLGLVEFHAI